MMDGFIHTLQFDQQRSYISNLAEQYKEPYFREFTSAEGHESYLDGIIQDIKEMRRDCLEAADLAKKYLKDYEAVIAEQARFEGLHEKLEDRLNDVSTELSLANGEIGHRDNKIELLERELIESENSYKILYNEHAKSKRTIQHLRKEIDSTERAIYRKEVVETIQKHLLNYEPNTEDREKAEKLQTLLTSKEAELQAIIARLDQIEAELINEVSINEENKLIIAKLTSENEEHKREAEEYRIKHKISEETLHNYEMEINQFRAMISNLDRGKAKFSGLSLSDMHLEDVIPIVESPRNTPSLGDMFDEKEFEHREDTPVMVLFSRRNQIKTPTAFRTPRALNTPRAFKFEHVLNDLKVHTCGGLGIEGKNDVDKSNLKFKIEVTHHSNVDIQSRMIQSIDFSTQTSVEMRNLQNQCGLSIMPERRIHEVCYLDNCLVDIQNGPVSKPILSMRKDSVSYSIICEGRNRDYEIVRKGEITIPSVEVAKPNLEIVNGMYVSFIDTNLKTNQFSLYKSPAIEVKPVNLPKSLKIRSEQQFSIQSIKNKPKSYVRRSLNSATASGRSLYCYDPKPIFNHNPIHAYKPYSNPLGEASYAQNQHKAPNRPDSEFRLSTTLSTAIPSFSRNMSTHNESIIEIQPINHSLIESKTYEQSQLYAIEISPPESYELDIIISQSTLETKTSDCSDVEHHRKQISETTKDSVRFSFQKEYSNSLISYEDSRSVKPEISSRSRKSRRSRTGSESCARCIII